MLTIHILLSKELELAYIKVPKNASTTMTSAFFHLAGVDADVDQPLNLFHDPAFKSQFDSIGLEWHQITGPADLERFFESYSSYLWTASVRDPVGRLVSAYFNKLNRYTKRFAKGVFCYGKAMQAIGGPKAWDNNRLAIEAMRRKLSLDDLVKGLVRNGIDFDMHFRPQSDFIRPDIIRLDKVIRVEHLEADFRSLAASVRSTEPDMWTLPTLNSTTLEKGRSSIEVTPQAKQGIYEIYRSDYDILGYS
ncbi:Sulfotransferase family protein [Shimia gijangensis]|uniref:Sulfotransferase family protein n=1 Tax=Shimia gijangensis TaxID=1470563 RepID=A0A1M6Q849_9RHOB|nr:sulfotransferase family 2 domain-containing protein [Shimia gijangensis]SHK16449.1 Sulfotransferase family protein [Shimia gijangensis]